MIPKDPDFSTMDDHEVAMMEWRGHVLRDLKANGNDLTGVGCGYGAVDLARLSELADAELTRRGIRQRFC